MEYNPKNSYSDIKKYGNNFFNQFSNFFFNVIHFMTRGKIDHENIEEASVMNFVSKPLWIAIYIIILFPLCGLTWLYFAPVGKAIITTGQIKAYKDNIILEAARVEDNQSIEKIYFKEGDKVKEGDILIKFNTDTLRNKLIGIEQSLTNNYMHISKYKSILSVKELNNIDYHNINSIQNLIKLLKNLEPYSDKNIQKFVFKSPLLQHQNIMSCNIIKDNIIQKLEAYISNNDHYHAIMNILEEQIATKKNIITKEDLTALLKIKNSLYNDGLLSLTEYTDTKRNINRDLEMFDDLEQKLLQTKMNIDQNLHRTAESLNHTLQSYAEHLSKYESESIRNIMDYYQIHNSIKKSIIKSPTNGTINKIFKKYLDIPLVSLSQQPHVIEIVPDSDYYITCSVPQNYIGSVKEGMKATLQFVALKSQINRDFEGTIEFVGADIDQMSAMQAQSRQKIYDNEDPQMSARQPVLMVRIKFDVNELKEYIETHGPEYRFSSGMLAQIWIKTPDQNYLSYILSPFTNTMKFGFKE